MALTPSQHSRSPLGARNSKALVPSPGYSYISCFTYADHVSTQVTIFVQTIKDYHAFSVQFELPDIREHYASKPTSFLAHFFGHEGRGSICAYLKKRGWLLDLSASDSGDPRSVQLFKVEGTLTLEGYREALCIALGVHAN